MFKKTTAIAAAFMMAAAMASCAHQTVTPEGTLIEQVEAAGLPPIPASEEEIAQLGHETCMARADGFSKLDMVEIHQYGPLFHYYSEEQIYQLNDIMYANFCRDFR